MGQCPTSHPPAHANLSPLLAHSLVPHCDIRYPTTLARSMGHDQKGWSGRGKRYCVVGHRRAPTNSAFRLTPFPPWVEQRVNIDVAMF
jgi:hypothetical protein